MGLWTELRTLRRFQKRPIILASMPKTASRTLLERLALSCPNRRYFPTSGRGMGHLAVNPSRFKDLHKAALKGQVPLLYQHFIPTDFNTLQLRGVLNLDDVPKAILLTRNIFDLAVSAEDHMRSAGFGPLSINRDEARYMSDEGLPFLSTNWTVFLSLQIYAAWVMAADQGTWDVKFIPFDDVVDRPLETVSDVLDFFGVHDRLTAATQPSIAQVTDNVNVGVKGRGNQLDPALRESIMTFCKAYDGVDFTPLGVV